MQVLFEDEGALKVGTELSSTPGSYQVELPGGRRAKVKAGHILLRFERPAGPPVLQQAEQEASGIDLDFLWQCAPQEEFGFQELAREYFAHDPVAVEAPAVPLRLYSPPEYFPPPGYRPFR